METTSSDDLELVDATKTSEPDNTLAITQKEDENFMKQSWANMANNNDE